MPVGRPQHEPTEFTRRLVADYSKFGIPQEKIALCLEICVDTLAKHYRRELDLSTDAANVEVANKLYNRAIEQNDLAAQIFWLKTRGGWRDANKIVDELLHQNQEQKEELARIRHELAEKHKKPY